MKKTNIKLFIFLIAILACSAPLATPNLSSRSFSVKIKTPLPNSIYYVGRVVGISADIPIFSTGNSINTIPKENDRLVVGWSAFYANGVFLTVNAPQYASTVKQGYFYASHSFIPRTPGEYVIRVEVGRFRNDPNPVSASVKICVLDEANPNTALCPIITGTPQRLESIPPSATVEPPLIIEITPSATLPVILKPTRKPKSEDEENGNNGGGNSCVDPGTCPFGWDPFGCQCK